MIPRRRKKMGSANDNSYIIAAGRMVQNSKGAETTFTAIIVPDGVVFAGVAGPFPLQEHVKPTSHGATVLAALGLFGVEVSSVRDESFYIRTNKQRAVVHFAYINRFLSSAAAMLLASKSCPLKKTNVS